MQNFSEVSKKVKYAYSKMVNSLNRDSLQYLLDTRAYFKDEQKDFLTEMNIFSLDSIPDLTESEHELFKELGCFSDNGYFLLERRYIIPVYSAGGEMITIIGWFNDTRKYITLPTPYFSKKVDWFNIDHALKISFSRFNGLVFVVEGIFDALSLRALGLPVVATMGADVTASKAEVLKVFNKVVAIPDNDKTGKKAIRDQYRQWKLPNNATFLELRGKVNFGEGKEFPVKDVDNLVSWFDTGSVKEMLLDVSKSNDKYVIMNL